MADRTRFLARLIGLYCLSAGLLMLLQRAGMIAAVTAVVQSGALLLILGVVIVPAGLAMILAHNVWSGGALPVIVTVIGWLTLLKGLMFWILPPAGIAQLYLQQLHYAELFYLYAGASFVIGVYLTWQGFRRPP
jgi:hypothetical protein